MRQESGIGNGLQLLNLVFTEDKRRHRRPCATRHHRRHFQLYLLFKGFLAQQQPLPPLCPRCGTLQVKQQLLQVELLEGLLLGPL